ncbi:septum formation initiator family protein [Candidatus Uhrbacteria bacterium]|nr:septum formation initiator family protein [Candidatus Uhrbacteria bacterium]
MARNATSALGFARWPLLVAASGTLFLVVGISTVRETYREWQVDQEIHQMQAQIEQYEGRKLSLVELLARLDSDEALDKEARTRLGLRKPGERVIILQGGDGLQASWQDDVQTPVVNVAVADLRSNPRRWLDYFFPRP